jgi:hypothetical protein
MKPGERNFISLREIEGVISPHVGFLETEIGRKKEALEYLDDVSRLADYIGGRVEKPGLGEDWAIKKEALPGVEILFVYQHADEEFPSNLRVLYSGERIRKVRGEDLVALTMAFVNHMLRYIREIDPARKLPEICYRV